jgi:hypothetical protein
MISISKDTSHPRPLAFQQVGGGMLGKCQRAAMPGEDSAGIKRVKAAEHRDENQGNPERNRRDVKDGGWKSLCEIDVKLGFDRKPGF